MDWAVIVVGAGPGGSTAARFAAEGGARTLLLEKRTEIGVPVRCGEGSAPRWLQVYILKDRERSAAAIARSAEQGYGAVMLTVDVVRQGNRRRDARNRWAFLQSDGGIEDPNDTHSKLSQLPGVAENGIFIDLCDVVVEGLDGRETFVEEK